MAGIRIGGLATGMDTDQIISDLMKAEKIPLDKLEQKKSYMEWQRDDYRDMNKSLLEFDTMIFDGVFRKATYLKKDINISDPDSLAIKNLSSSSDFSGTIKIDKLATSTRVIGGDTGITDSSVKLSDLGLTGTQKITINAPNKDGSGTIDYTLEFDPAEKSLNDVISDVNAKSGVSVFFDSYTKQIAVSAENTGAGDITLTDDSGTFFSAMKLSAGDATKTMGENAEITYNGLATQRASNTFQLNGFEFTLKDTSTKDVTFSSSPDVDSILETVVKFVDKYNEVIKKVNDEINEKKYRDFQPLTAEQKEGMEEKEIELWDEKAKSGTLRNDSTLSRGVNSMRLDLNSPVSGIANTMLSDIGIKPSSNYLDRGKLIIDEAKLREAISEDPNAIYDLFAKDGATSEEQGVARRLRDSIKDTMRGIEVRAGKATSTTSTYTLGRNLDSIEDSIDRFEDKLIQIEDRYWRQFTAMEKAIQKANSQATYLMQQFSY
ncbi:flagellar hook-associated protein 2 [Bacillus sp. 2205SS5-2]|uniref:flagellar hook-associated protein 2 n=1 Tax=Bacillus sp. 2205SS5-2 TaxID=3109031 RepID=UPI00300722FC